MRAHGAAGEASIVLFRSAGRRGDLLATARPGRQSAAEVSLLRQRAHHRRGHEEHVRSRGAPLSPVRGCARELLLSRLLREQSHRPGYPPSRQVRPRPETPPEPFTRDFQHSFRVDLLRDEGLHTAPPLPRRRSGVCAACASFGETPLTAGSPTGFFRRIPRSCFIRFATTEGTTPRTSTESSRIWRRSPGARVSIPSCCRLRRAPRSSATSLRAKPEFARSISAAFPGRSPTPGARAIKAIGACTIPSCFAYLWPRTWTRWRGRTPS